jgi:hypothetical protein
MSMGMLANVEAEALALAAAIHRCDGDAVVRTLYVLVVRAGRYGCLSEDQTARMLSILDAGLGGGGVVGDKPQVLESGQEVG